MKKLVCLLALILTINLIGCNTTTSEDTGSKDYPYKDFFEQKVFFKGGVDLFLGEDIMDNVVEETKYNQKPYTTLEFKIKPNTQIDEVTFTIKTIKTLKMKIGIDAREYMIDAVDNAYSSGSIITIEDNGSLTITLKTIREKETGNIDFGKFPGSYSDAQRRIRIYTLPQDWIYDSLKPNQSMSREDFVAGNYGLKITKVSFNVKAL